MRKLLRMAAGGLFVLPMVSQARAADDTGKVYYKDGTRIELPESDMKINLHIQPRFTFQDNDDSGRRDAGLDPVHDVDSFDVKRAQLFFSGNILNKQFSYKIQDDFRAESGGSRLKDAWLQWNNSAANIRAGQFKVPFSRNENESDAELEFIDRAQVSDIFSPSRQLGAMVHGEVASGVNYFLESYNGPSKGEGINKAGVDNNLSVAGAVTANFGDYGSRSSEGDLRANNASTAFTTGLAAIYGEGSGDPLALSADGDFNRFDLNADFGVRSNGFAAQTEFYYSHIDLDDVSGDNGEGDLFGFYLQAGYLIDPKWEAAARFGYFQPDHDLNAIDDQEEYNLVINYFLNGHNLKLQNGVTWAVTNYGDGSDGDIVDFRYEMQLNGYF